MARRYDSEQTAKLLLDAGAVEFAEHGIAGARVDKIAERAGVNKTAIYAYYGNKEELFAAALEEKLGELSQQVTIRSDKVPEYAGALFDFVCDHPQIVRLYEHEGMYYGPDASPGFDKRAQYHQERVAVIREAAGDNQDAESIFLAILGMAYWFVAAPQVVRMIYGAIDSESIRVRYRAQIVETARALVAPTAVA